MTDTFAPCEICGARDWHIVYRGNVRNDIFGRSQSDATVSRCGDCGADRLDESVCPDMVFYETEACRKKLQEELTAAGHYAVADELQVVTQKVIWPDSLRGKTAENVGCAGGSFVHRYGMANMLAWLRDRRPAGIRRVTSRQSAPWRMIYGPAISRRLAEQIVPLHGAHSHDQERGLNHHV